MRFVGVSFLLALLLLIPFLFWGEQFEEWFTRDGVELWLRRYGAWVWIPALSLLTADVALPVPGTAVMAALGVAYGPLLGGAIGGIGSCLGGIVAYSACRLFGHRAAVWIAGEDEVRRGERFFATKGGGWAVALSRWLPLLPEVIACIAGVARMPTRRFLLALACGSFPMAFAFATVGWSGRQRPTTALILSALLPLILWPIAARLLYGINRPGREESGDDEAS